MKSIHFENIDSTSTYLKQNHEKYDNFTFVSAGYQTNGHGRENRTWVSRENENLLFSILIKDDELINKFASLSLASAACIYDVLIEAGLKNVSIKWPNDVLVNGKKICGILLEGISQGKGLEAIVIGVGLNINSIEFSLVDNCPTSMFLELKKTISLEGFKEIVYKKFINMFECIKVNDASYLSVVREHNYLKGKLVYAIIDEKKTLVEVIDINNDNSLKVKVKEKYVDVSSGEITFHI